MTRPPLLPLDVPCPRCHARPHQACRSLVFRTRRPANRPHLDRITDARNATLRGPP